MNSMLDISDMYVEYIFKGLHVLKGAAILEQFSADDFDFTKSEYFPVDFDIDERVNYFSQPYRDNLIRLRDAVSNTLLQGIDHRLEYYDSTSYVEYETSLWHSDHADMSLFPGFNLTLNCYFSDSDENTGGNLAFTKRENLVDQTPIDEQQVHSTYPKKHDIIFFNQIDFVHRATPTDRFRPYVAFMLQLPFFFNKTR